MRGANFIATTAPDHAAQLYSTASYQAHDLTGIRLGGNNLTGVNLAGQNLTNANFYVRHADQRESQPGQPHECELLLRRPDRREPTGAEVRGASFANFGCGLTLAQLYSTASYQAHDLTGINLAGNNLAGVNFAGQNLTNADFSSSYCDFYE